MVKLDIKASNIDEIAHGYTRKGSAVDAKLNHMNTEILNILKRWIRHEAPRKTGKLKADVQMKNYQPGGAIYMGNATKYWEYVIDGTRAHDIVPKYKKALKVPGWGVFKKVHHPGTKPNAFMDRGLTAANGEINREIKIFEDWLVSDV